MTKASALFCILCGIHGIGTAVTALVPVTKCIGSEIRTGQRSTENSLHRRNIIPLHARRKNAPIEDDEKNDSNIDDIRFSDMSFKKAVRVAKAKAKVEKIQKSMEFDVEKEMSKVVDTSIEGLAPEEQSIEDTVSEIETDLFDAIEREDFDVAILKKEELGKMHVDDCGAVLQVNSAFYKAFSEKDYDLMDSVWLKDKSVLCIHPASPVQVGGRDVMASWKELFETSERGAMHRTWTEPSEMRLVVRGATATLTCDEDIYIRQFVRGKTRETQLVNKLRATNIFRKVGGKWFLYHHHASWHEDSTFARRAMDEVQAAPASTLPADGESGMQVIYPKGGDITDADATGKNLLDGTVGKSGLGPLLGGSSSADNKSNPPKRIIMGGSLSDILKEGLGDMLGGPEGINNNNANGNGNDNDGMGKIIRFKFTSDDDDTTDGENEGDDDLGSEINEALSMMNEWAGNRGGVKPSSPKQSNTLTNSQTNGSNAPKDALRQNCISAIRKLCNQGSITQRHKRLLLSDIISCSAKGEFSKVEVAYELLCGESDEDNDDAHEDFADQCLIHVRSLMDKE